MQGEFLIFRCSYLSIVSLLPSFLFFLHVFDIHVLWRPQELLLNFLELFRLLFLKTHGDGTTPFFSLRFLLGLGLCIFAWVQISLDHICDVTDVFIVHVLVTIITLAC